MKILKIQNHLVLDLKKEQDNIIIHIGTNDSLYKTEDFKYKEMVNAKKTINRFHPDCKHIAISSPTVRTDKKKMNNILKKQNNNLKQECHLSPQHCSIAFTQGWSALKF